jgi:small nuclear ribonucleoprotein (snRNP)-like protein
MSTPKARKAQKRALPKSLVIILKALEGQEVTLELRNEIDIRGTIDFVDDSMK